jgi:hypothetical protein
MQRFRRIAEGIGLLRGLVRAETIDDGEVLQIA